MWGYTAPTTLPLVVYVELHCVWILNVSIHGYVAHQQSLEIMWAMMQFHLSFAWCMPIDVLFEIASSSLEHLI